MLHDSSTSEVLHVSLKKSFISVSYSFWNSGSIIGTEAELDEEETEATEKSVADRDQLKNEIQKNEEQTSALPSTPLRLSRLILKLFVVEKLMFHCY